jgi:hypothetical protein
MILVAADGCVHIVQFMYIGVGRLRKGREWQECTGIYTFYRSRVF